jgi:hypothetical protein
MFFKKSSYVLLPLIFIATTSFGAITDGSRCHTQLKSATPDNEILHIDIDHDGKPDIIERWWNGKRVRWLDESGTMRKDDMRGDLVNGEMQVDMDGDGSYDGPDDMNIRWCDTDNDGIPDVQAIVINPHQWGLTKETQTGHPVWMVWINHDKRGVLGWINWEKFDFACWDYTGADNWLPNYHGNNDFVKTHAPAYAFNDPRLNWENPFSFYDEDGDGLSEMVMRWCAPVPTQNGRVGIPPNESSAFLAYDLDNNSGYGNETSYDMTLAVGGATVPINQMVHPLPHFKGDPKFDPYFNHNEWRKVSELIYMDRNKGYETFFNTNWKNIYLTFDEDGDDHRWERVESLYPTIDYSTKGPAVDPYSTARFKNKEGVPAGMDGAFQADSRGDRGDFDMDGSGGGKLYISPLDGKIHLYGAEWGAWTVDRNAEFHGGAGEPTRKPEAKTVGEVIKYTDTDGDGFYDTMEFDYDGDRKIDFKVCLLDYKSEKSDPQKTILFEPGKLGWKGMHQLFNSTAQQTWEEALSLYRAGWQKDLTTPEMDKMAASSSLRQRYMNAYWIKEDIFKAIREHLAARILAHPSETSKLQHLLADYIKAYYTSRFDKAALLIAQIPTA